MADYKPNRYFADGYFPDGYFGPRQTQAPVEPRGGLEQLTATAWYGRRKTRKQLELEALRKKKKAKRTGVRHDEDDVIAILLALT